MRTKTLLLLGALLLLSVACATDNGPKVDFGLDETGVSLTSDAVDVSLSTTGVAVETGEFEVNVSACVVGDGRMAGALSYLPLLGDLILKYISCPGV